MTDPRSTPKPGEEGYRVPKPGDQRYSNFFDSYIEMVAYTSDRDYYFKVLDNPKYPPERILKNQSPWSDLSRSQVGGGPRSR